MLISCPIIRIRQPFSVPEEWPHKKSIQLWSKFLISSEQIDKSFRIMRCIKSIMPSISLNVMIREYVDSLKLRNVDKSTIPHSGFKELRFFIPNVFIKLGTSFKLLFDLWVVGQVSHFTYSEIIITELEGLAACWMSTLLLAYIS